MIEEQKRRAREQKQQRDRERDRDREREREKEKDREKDTDRDRDRDSATVNERGKKTTDSAAPVKVCTAAHTHTHTQPFTALFPDHPGEPVPEQNFCTLWCKGRLTEADTPSIQLGTTPSGLTSTHLHHPAICFTGWMPFRPPNQQRQSTEGN